MGLLDQVLTLQGLTTLLAVLSMMGVVGAYLAGAPIPESVLGIALGALASIAGNAVASGKERTVIELPAGYKVKKFNLEVVEE